MKDNPSGGEQIVLVFGPTGTAGAGAVQACLQYPGVTEVRAVTRRSLGIKHARLREVSCTDFKDFGLIAPAFDGVDACLFCLGTSVRNVKGEDEYRRIHVTYALAAARMLVARSPEASFVYLSGAGAKRTSWMMWARLKAEAEDRLAELALIRQVNARPAGILPMQPKGANRWLLTPLVKAIPALGIGSADLGKAMLLPALDRSWVGNRTLDNHELLTLSTKANRP